MDRIINISVGGNYLKRDKKSAGVRGEANVTTLRITFDNSWDNYAKTVTFLDARGQNPVNVVLGVNLLEDITKDELVYLVPIPAEPMAISGELTFIIEGVLDNKIQKSFADRLEVKDAPDTAGAVNAADPTPSEVEQLKTEIEFIKGTFSYIGDDGIAYVWSKKSGEYVPVQTIRGADGKSAYDLAKEGGYTRTEEEFVALLNGLTSSPDAEHYQDLNNPHKVTAEQVGSLKIYNGFAALNKEIDTNFDSDTPIETIIGAMPDNTGLKADINTHNAGHSGTTIYPVVYGILSIYKIRSNRVEVEYVSNTAAGGIEHNKRWIGQYNSGVFGGFVQVYTEQHKPTASDVGAVHLAQHFSGKDVLSMPDEGNYYITNAQNTPTGGRAGYLQVVQHPTASDYRVIYWRGYNDNTEYINVLEAGTWLGWSANLHTGNIKDYINDYIISKGAYVGTGTTSKTIYIRKTTQMVIVYGANSSYGGDTFGVLIRGMTQAHCSIAKDIDLNLNVSWADTSVTFGLENAEARYSWNKTDFIYHYVVIG